MAGMQRSIDLMTDSQRRLLGLLLAYKRQQERQQEEQDEEGRGRSCWVRPIFQRRVTEGSLFSNVDWMKENDPESFRNFLRLTPSQFDYVLSLIHVDIAPSDNSFREPIAAKDRLAVVLRYLAGGDSMISLSYSCNVSKTSITRFIQLVCEALWKHLMPIVMPVPTTEKWLEVAEEMNRKWQLPHCVGAIDGKHVVMQAPPNAGSAYYNYKGTHSIVLLGVCDANYRFLLVDIGGSGRNSDGGVFAASSFGRAMNAGTLRLPPPSLITGIGMPIPYFFVGDAAFPLKENLMRPYPGRNLDIEKRIFNYRLSRSRNTIENAFGILSARFRVFRGPINAKVETVCSITKAAVCLHNFLMEADQELPDKDKIYCPPRYDDTEDANGNILRGAWRRLPNGFLNLRRTPFNFTLNARQARESLQDFCNHIGPLSWQIARVNAAS